MCDGSSSSAGVNDCAPFAFRPGDARECVGGFCGKKNCRGLEIRYGIYCMIAVLCSIILLVSIVSSNGQTAAQALG
jgi:hypothetical protein